LVLLECPKTWVLLGCFGGVCFVFCFFFLLFFLVFFFFWGFFCFVVWGFFFFFVFFFLFYFFFFFFFFFFPVPLTEPTPGDLLQTDGHLVPPSTGHPRYRLPFRDALNFHPRAVSSSISCEAPLRKDLSPPPVVL